MSTLSCQIPPSCIYAQDDATTRGTNGIFDEAMDTIGSLWKEIARDEESLGRFKNSIETTRQLHAGFRHPRTSRTTNLFLRDIDAHINYASLVLSNFQTSKDLFNSHVISFGNETIFTVAFRRRNVITYDHHALIVELDIGIGAKLTRCLIIWMKALMAVWIIVVFTGIPNSGNYRNVGRRKEGECKEEKHKKNDDGEKYERKNNGGRRGSQGGNGSSGMEGSGEGSGNGEDSSDENDDDEDDLPEDEEEEEEEEEGDDEEDLEDTDNISPIAEDDVDHTTNGGSAVTEESRKVTSTTLDIHADANEDDENTSTSSIAPVQPGTPVTLSGVIWKETMGGVLVVNLKWRNKTYSGSLIDHSRHGWANPRHFEEAQEESETNSVRNTKTKKAKHKESAYTGNPLSPKLSSNGKRASRFHRNKGKHGKESSTKSKGKRGSDNGEEGTRTRRRSCTVKVPVSQSPSPTSFIECPKRNCNKRYKQISGLRYHQSHAHHDNDDDDDDKDSYDEDDVKEPLSANSKSSGSDDVKPLSHRKAKNQKLNTKVNEASLPDEKNNENNIELEETGEKCDDVIDVKITDADVISEVKVEDKCDVKDIKNDVIGVEEIVHTKMEVNEKADDKFVMESDSKPMKIEESETRGAKSNILEEAAKIIFDESMVSQDLMVPAGIFSRMTSQAMIAAQSHPEYVEYEPMDDYSEKDETSSTGKDLDVTIKEEVIDEGHAEEANITGENQSEDSLKLDSSEMNVSSGSKSSEFTVEEAPKSLDDDNLKWSSEKATKSRKNDCANVPKEQIKTSAAEIRALSGYNHFRLPPKNSSGFLTSTKLTLDTGLLESKDLRKGEIAKDIPRLERTAKKADGKSMMWKVQGAPSVSSASFQLSCESKARPGYITSSRKSSVVTASTTWVPEVHHAVLNKIPGGGVPGQEVIPEKPAVPRELAETSRDEEMTTEDEKIKCEKGDDEKSKTSCNSKPVRAVGVAHPFNAEKSVGEFALGMVGSISTDPVRVLYSKSSSPKMSLDHNHPDMTEVKKVRVEKTLEVPIGEVVPVAKTGRSALTPESRSSVMIGNEARLDFTDPRVSAPSDERIPLIITSSPPLVDSQQAYATSSNRLSPWQRTTSHSPSRDNEPRSRLDTGQQYTHSETFASRKARRRSPVPDHRSSPVRGGYLTPDIDRRTSEKELSPRGLDSHRGLDPRDYDAHRGYDPPRGFDSHRGIDHQRSLDKRIPFRNIDERLPHKDVSKVMESSRNSPAKDLYGGMNPTRCDSPRRDSPSTFHTRLSVGYRDTERGSPFNEARRQRDKSPIADRRSPATARRSPEIVERSTFRDTSPSHARDNARSSPYRDRGVKSMATSELVRKDNTSPITGSSELSRGYRSTSKEPGDNTGSRGSSMDNKYSRMSEEEAMMMQAHDAAFYQYQRAAAAAAAAGSQDVVAARDIMENYMMYYMQPYPAMLPAAQMPLLISPGKDNNLLKEERVKDVSAENINRKGNHVKLESDQQCDQQTLAGKRHAERPSNSRERIEFESTPMKRSRTNEMKDVHELIDERDGGRLQFKTLEQRALQQQLQHKMDALNQLQTEKNLKMKAEDKLIRSKPSSSSSSGSSSRTKSSMHESRSLTKRDSKISGKEDKRLASPIGGHSSNERSRNPENKSPLSSGSSAHPYLNYVLGPNLPANHALSKSYEQAMAIHGAGYFMSPFPGMMMAGPALVPGTQLHNTITSRVLDPKRDSTRGSSMSGERQRSAGDDSRDTEPRNDIRDFHSNDDVCAPPRINPPPSPPPANEKSKEKSRSDYDDGKHRRDNSSLHEGPALPANLAFRRADMTGPMIDPAQFNPRTFPGFMYPGAQGNFRPPYDHPHIRHQRK